MPVSKERRYFIRDGKVECHHPYWPEQAIIGCYTKDLPDNWRYLLSELNQETEEEISLLTNYAEQLGQYLSGYWSIDFARGQDGTWYFDAALGNQSWHSAHQKEE